MKNFQFKLYQNKDAEPGCGPNDGVMFNGDVPAATGDGPVGFQGGTVSINAYDGPVHFEGEVEFEDGSTWPIDGAWS